MTVSDIDRAVTFYSGVLSFHKVSDIEVTGEEYEHLEGVFGVRMRVVRMRLGDEFINLTEYLAPKGRPIPRDARSNDRSFQHIAIIVSDMGRAYWWLRQNNVEHASSGPQRLPDWNKNAAGISALYFKDPDEHPLEVFAVSPR
jgi:catechol 2,3-dioxygenase-like lactoylglutathione lyase family enzyme